MIVVRIRTPGTTYSPRMLDAYECPGCFCLFLYLGCGHNCLVVEDNDGFEERDNFMWDFEANLQRKNQAREFRIVPTRAPGGDCSGVKESPDTSPADGDLDHTLDPGP